MSRMIGNYYAIRWSGTYGDPGFTMHDGDSISAANIVGTIQPELVGVKSPTPCVGFL
jgi:hypothetical protein